MTTAALTLESQTRKTHEARRRLAVARGMLRKECDATEDYGHDPMRDLYEDAELMLIAEEDTLRALAVAAFHATGLQQVSPGITVTEHITGFRFEDGDRVPVIIPVVTLADDLGAALDAAGEAQTPETWR